MGVGASEGPVVASGNEQDADQRDPGEGGRDTPSEPAWTARWLQPGRVAWATFLVIWGGLVVVGAPAGLAMLPAAICAVTNLTLLRIDQRTLRPTIPDTIPAAWSGIIDDGPDGSTGPAG